MGLHPELTEASSDAGRHLEWQGVVSGATEVNLGPESRASPEPCGFWAVLRSLGLILKDGTQSRRVNIIISSVTLKCCEGPCVGNGHEEPEGSQEDCLRSSTWGTMTGVVDVQVVSGADLGNNGQPDQRPCCQIWGRRWEWGWLSLREGIPESESPGRRAMS